MSISTRIGFAACLSLVSCLSANAADITPLMAPAAPVEETESGWQFAVAPYFWMAGLSGDTKQFGLPTVHIDSDFSDIWDNLDFAAMAIAEARKDKFSFYTDLIYTKLSGDGKARGIFTDSVEVESETFAGLLAAGYTVLEDQNSYLDIVGGVKIWSVDTTISFHGGPLDGVSRDDGKTWVDGMVGLRGAYYLTPEIYLTAWGLVGAGGADIDWDTALGIGYRFNDTVSAVLGYRALGVNYDNDGFIFDAVQQGPILGVSIRF
ncbi:hypothetical protein [Ensifer sp. MJa1]|uniref:hypothetical protein n=1 Tax=Ensifer sp. MJa1 TaxID=2919888 RepID=UPI003FA5404B